MSALKIGVMAESFRVDLKNAVKMAAGLGVNGLQFYATQGDVTPENMTRSACSDLLHYVGSHSLVISALCGELGGQGFAVPKDNEWKIERLIKVMDLAVMLRTNVVTAHVGVIPGDRSDARYAAIKEACEAIGKYAEKTGAFFAIETGAESPDDLKSFLEDLDTRGIRVNYDPANLVMVLGIDPVPGVYTLKDYIVHTHAKDGVKLSNATAEEIYGHFASGGIGDFRIQDHIQEKPLGEGDVDFDAYVSALGDTGYDGFYTIEKETGENPVEDIGKAVDFLKKY